jgi:hypothetical protein
MKKQFSEQDLEDLEDEFYEKEDRMARKSNDRKISLKNLDKLDAQRSGIRQNNKE